MQQRVLIVPRLAVLVFAIAMAPFVVGCASILNRTATPVEFQSDTAGTQVVVKSTDSKQTMGPVQTPATLILDKGRTYDAVFTTADGRELRHRLGKRFDPVTLINILGLLGFIADAFTGALQTYDGEAYRADFRANQVHVLASPTATITIEPTPLPGDDGDSTPPPPPSNGTGAGDNGAETGPDGDTGTGTGTGTE